MPSSKPQLVALHQLTPHVLSDFFALLSDHKLANTRDGKPYYACLFKDKFRTVSSAIWADHAIFRQAESWTVGSFYKLRGTFSVNDRYGPQVELQQVREVKEEDRADGFRETDFYDCSRFDPEKMLAELRQIAETEIVGEPLRKLVLSLLDAHGLGLMKLPAHEKRFFPFPGGWLEHTLSVTRNCLMLVDRYREYYPEFKPPLNRDLLLAGAILHDLGRVAELQPPTVPGQPYESTIPGRLFGHITLGRDLVRDAGRRIPELDSELLQLLEHLIQAHLTLPEWGSQRLPLIPEVLILHHADDLDAKLEMYFRCLTRDTSAGPFTDRDPMLGKPLLKQRKE